MAKSIRGKMPVFTNFIKLHNYTSAKYMTDDEILAAVAGEGSS
jgi:hypothetical protein